MNNSTLIASGFLTASFMCTVFVPKSATIFFENLDENEKKIYLPIIKQRLNHYWFGLVLGILISFIVLRNINLDKQNYAFTFLAIALTIQYFFYQLYPKLPSIAESIDSKEDLKRWLTVYNDYKIRYHVGFLLGAIGVYFIGLSINQ